MKQLSRISLFKLNDVSERILKILKDLLYISRNSLVIVNDHHRSTPTAKIINALRETGKLACSVDFLIATGSHHPPSLEVARKIAGAEKSDRIFLHDIRGANEYSCAGKTSRETNVSYNSMLNKYERIITIGSVEPHYFAGFTGGAKSIFPGVAAYNSIEQNHRWAMSEGSEILKTTRNPVFEDIWESANMIRPLKEIQSIQLVNDESSIISLSTGTLPEAFEEAKTSALKYYWRKVERKFDRIISYVKEPLNRDLYQSQKALENCRSVLKPCGTIVLVSECHEEVGLHSYFERLTQLGSPENVMRNISFDNYRLGDHKAYKFAQLAMNAELLYVGSLDSETVSKAFMKKIDEHELVSLRSKWEKGGENILIDKDGGFATYY
ncbi:MAG TPA: hypothetical protein DD381_01175 [Lentisphaeria bacterium]|nr:MAG: hypothetical protein A2X47_13485 [Lentisphaerae bacterium GWF2_38_69]HBM14955.1 hypothetical protein [Lentisphaeria bacterium]